MLTFQGYVKDPLDAVLLLESCRLGSRKRVHRRLSESERHAFIRSGACFVWDEDESGIKRWTDGKQWSSSRIQGSFLMYREVEARKAVFLGAAPLKSEGNITPVEYVVKDFGLTKKAISFTLNTGKKQHLVAYFTEEDLRAVILQSPQDCPEFHEIEIPREIYPDYTPDGSVFPPSHVMKQQLQLQNQMRDQLQNQHHHQHQMQQQHHHQQQMMLLHPHHPQQNQSNQQPIPQQNPPQMLQQIKQQQHQHQHMGGPVGPGRAKKRQMVNHPGPMQLHRQQMFMPDQQRLSSFEEHFSRPPPPSHLIGLNNHQHRHSISTPPQPPLGPNIPAYHTGPHPLQYEYGGSQVKLEPTPAGSRSNSLDYASADNQDGLGHGGGQRPYMHQQSNAWPPPPPPSMQSLGPHPLPPGYADLFSGGSGGQPHVLQQIKLDPQAFSPPLFSPSRNPNMQNMPLALPSYDRPNLIPQHMAGAPSSENGMQLPPALPRTGMNEMSSDSRHSSSSNQQSLSGLQVMSSPVDFLPSNIGGRGPPMFVQGNPPHDYPVVQGFAHTLARSGFPSHLQQHALNNHPMPRSPNPQSPMPVRQLPSKMQAQPVSQNQSVAQFNTNNHGLHNHNVNVKHLITNNSSSDPPLAQLQPMSSFMGVRGIEESLSNISPSTSVVDGLSAGAMLIPSMEMKMVPTSLPMSLPMPMPMIIPMIPGVHMPSPFPIQRFKREPGTSSPDSAGLVAVPDSAIERKLVALDVDLAMEMNSTSTSPQLSVDTDELLGRSQNQGNYQNLSASQIVSQSSNGSQSRSLSQSPSSGEETNIQSQDRITGLTGAPTLAPFDMALNDLNTRKRPRTDSDPREKIGRRAQTDQ